MTTHNCYNCTAKREVPGNCHIKCATPDPAMRGNPHGVRNGWFIYPLLFDPVWCMTDCKNYAPIEPVEVVVPQPKTEASDSPSTGL